jgi:tryptophan halogenase
MKINEKPILIVGGGTAGWLSALFAKKHYPDSPVVCVASEKIGILGAGEGTTPSFLTALRHLNICMKTFVEECDVTVKTGIIFENWRGDQSSYTHSFYINSCSEKELPVGVRSSLLAEDDGYDRVTLGTRLNNTKRVPSIYDPEQEMAVHFNANKVAQYFKKVALNRGVEFIDDEVIDIELGDNQAVEKVSLSSHDPIHPCFVFDCSGFARLFIGKKYKTEWCDYTSELTTDSAIPFFVEHDNDVTPATRAIAMKHGWAWVIPVKDRYGCGYVFDSKKTSEKNVLTEIKEVFGVELKEHKKFNFKAGVFKEILKNNVLAVGLSSGFIEPLEATSLWVTTTALQTFFDSDGINNKSKFFADKFNDYIFNFNAEIKDFVWAHYVSDRNDTDFWKQFENLEQNKNVSGLRDSLNYNINGSYVNSKTDAFGSYSWSCVFSGLQQLDKKMLGIRASGSERVKDECVSDLMRSQNKFIFDKTFSHKDFIELKHQNI